MSMKTEAGATTQVYQIYIKASPQAIWDAITKPEWTEKFMYETRVEYELGSGGAYRGLPSDSMRKSGAEMGFEIPASSPTARSSRQTRRTSWFKPGACSWWPQRWSRKGSRA